jgi:hypothetical protein
MRRITLTLSLALGCLMTTQSFGFDLLDRMMGSRGNGCDVACCETPSYAGPACGCEAPACDSGCGPARGGLLGHLRGNGGHGGCCAAEPACGCEPACGIAAAPACGCEVAGCDSGCGSAKRGGLLSRLFGHGNRGCDAACCEAPCAAACAEPACGCEPACGIAAAPACGCEVASCDSGCGHGRRGGLLSRLFSGHRSSKGCDQGCDSGCGCGTPTTVPYSSPSMHSVPEAPAPIVDPSASVQSKRRVVQASARYVR